MARTEEELLNASVNSMLKSHGVTLKSFTDDLLAEYLGTIVSSQPHEADLREQMYLKINMVKDLMAKLRNASEAHDRTEAERDAGVTDQ